MRVVPWVVSDQLWARIEPLLPRRQRRVRYPGRKPLDDRLVLQGILFVLHTGIGWEHLPQELGFGCGMTAWRRLRAWQEAGVWLRLHEMLLTELYAAGELDWSRAIADSGHVQAKKGGAERSQPGRQGPSRQQAPPARRGQRAPACLDAHGRQPRRRHAAARAARPRAAGARPGRPAAATARAARRRPRLRPRRVPAAALATRDQAGDRPPRDPARLRTWPRALGRRAHLRMAPQPPSPAHPHRPPPRDPRGLSGTRLLPDLLAATRKLVVLGPLTTREGPLKSGLLSRVVRSTVSRCFSATTARALP
jgi:transposase